MKVAIALADPRSDATEWIGLFSRWKEILCGRQRAAKYSRLRREHGWNSEQWTCFWRGAGGKNDGVPDGIKVDKNGNLFVTGPKGIWVWDAKGNHLGTIVMPEQPANLTWGDKDYRTLYITATTSVYRLEQKRRVLCLTWNTEAVHAKLECHQCGSAKPNTSLPAEIATYWTPPLRTSSGKRECSGPC